MMIFRFVGRLLLWRREPALSVTRHRRQEEGAHHVLHARCQAQLPPKGCSVIRRKYIHPCLLCSFWFHVPSRMLDLKRKIFPHFSQPTKRQTCHSSFAPERRRWTKSVERVAAAPFAVGNWDRAYGDQGLVDDEMWTLL